ncbi:MAG: hypothetical protein RI895_522 [Actinomycetota bacterium]
MRVGKSIALVISSFIFTSLVSVPANAVDPSPKAKQWAVSAESAQYWGSPDPKFAPANATGAPDADACDGNGMWSPAGNEIDESWTDPESIILGYDNEVIPTEINVYQNYVQGAVSKIEVTASGDESWTTVYEGDPALATEGTCLAENQYDDILSVNVTGIERLISFVRITVDMSVVEGWAEIDAVELVSDASSGVTSVVGGTTTGSLVTAWLLDDDTTGWYLAFAKADELDTTGSCDFSSWNAHYYDEENVAKVGYKDISGEVNPLELTAYDDWDYGPGVEIVQFEPGVLYAVCLFGPGNVGQGSAVIGRASLLNNSAPESPAPVIANGYRADSLASVYFAPRSSKLSNKAQKTIAAAVAANPSAIYKVTGYVQNSNSTKLSLKRAKAVESYLESLGAGVTFTVVVESGQLSAKESNSKKARRATLFAMTPVVQ